MATRWHRHEYDREYEHHAHPERTGYDVPQEEVFEGYDPVHDRDVRFAKDWGELLAAPDHRPDPIDILPADMAISHAVCDLLNDRTDVDASKIGVYAEARAVTLRGTVGSLEVRRRILRATAEVPGVSRVIDQLRVREHA